MLYHYYYSEVSLEVQKVIMRQGHPYKGKANSDKEAIYYLLRTKCNKLQIIVRFLLQLRNVFTFTMNRLISLQSPGSGRPVQIFQHTLSPRTFYFKGASPELGGPGGF